MPQKSGPEHYKWNGGKKKTDKGYVRVIAKGHPRASDDYVSEHILVAEKALGKPLPDAAVVHHRDGDKANNDPTNLVICQDEAYHRLLHQRQRAYRACGHADWRKCRYCKKWDDPKNLSISKETIYHKACSALHGKEVRRAANR